MPTAVSQQLQRRVESGVPGLTVARLQAIADRWRVVLDAQQVILYGSVARGEATIHSDVDVLIVAPTAEPLYIRLATAERAVRDLRYGLPLSPLVLTPDELTQRLRRGDAFIQEIITTGIRL